MRNLFYWIVLYLKKKKVIWNKIKLEYSCWCMWKWVIKISFKTFYFLKRILPLRNKFILLTLIWWLNEKLSRLYFGVCLIIKLKTYLVHNKTNWIIYYLFYILNIKTLKNDLLNYVTKHLDFLRIRFSFTNFLYINT